MILVAVDPALNSSGLAIFRDGVLVYAGRVKCALGTSDDVAKRSLFMAARIRDKVWEHVGGTLSVEVATEWPQIYRGPKAEGDPNDLPAIGAVATSTAALLGAWDVRSYQPFDWAAHVPKTGRDLKTGRKKILPIEESPRAKRILSRLSGRELEVWAALKSSDHDAVDAVGIGLHALGRGIRQRASVPASL